jgi:hypothetical protein
MHVAGVALYLGIYNFVRKHKDLKTAASDSRWG